MAGFGFVMMIALLGLLARRQIDDLGRLVTTLYDHSFIGITYVSQAQAQYLRLIERLDPVAPFAQPAKQAQLRGVVDRLDVAIERASSQRTRDAAMEVRSMLAGLPALPTPQLSDRIAQIDLAIDTLVRSYSSDGLRDRDGADEVMARGERLVLMEVILVSALAILLAWLLANDLSPPLVALVRSMGLLAAGDLHHEVALRLAQRQDEIGAVARATSFFRSTMLTQIEAGEERVRLEAERETARQAAERSRELVQAKSDFLATMSHEIRTPMNGVATVADLLADTPLSAEQLRMVTIISQSAKWLVRVINDILDFSKLEAGQLHIETVPFMLDEVIASSCEVLGAKVREKGLVLSVEGRDLPGICRIGDPLRLRQILLNLLGNAVKFTAAGGVTVVLQAEPDAVTFSVVDTGIGIPADKIDNLFQPYNQLRSDMARSYGGTGLGLSITRNLIELMGGSLRVSSELGKGSCFSVSLRLPGGGAALCKPVGRAVASRAQWLKPEFAAAAECGAVVLCAEDNAINREVLARVLDRLGFHYEMAEDGVAALALLDRRRHGAVLTDAQMPRLDGWHLAEAIRQQEAEAPIARLPIVMLTANALSESDSRIQQTGIDAVLTKPLDRAALEATLLAAVPKLGELRQPAAETPPAPHDGLPAAAPVQAAQGPVAHPPARDPPALDLGVLAELVGDAPDDIGMLIEEFRVSASQQHLQLRAAAAADDVQAIGVHAHAMKGAARYAGATALAAICHRLEQRAKAGEGVAALAGDLALLDAAIERLAAEIASAMAQWRETRLMAPTG